MSVADPNHCPTPAAERGGPADAKSATGRAQRNYGGLIATVFGRTQGLLLLAPDPAQVARALVTVTGAFSPLTAAPLEGAVEPARGAVMYGVLGATEVELRQALRTAFELLAPGATILVIDAPAQTRTRLGRSDLSSALFAEGFVSQRALRGPHRSVAVSARRDAAVPPTQRDLTLSVVMPVYNEGETFTEVLDELLAKSIPHISIEVLIVESNSTDGTREKVLAYEGDPRVRIVLEDKPSGKGHAVRAGLAEARGDFVLIQDADREYDIADYDKLLAPLQAFQTSFVLGNRTPTAGAHFGLRHFEKQVFISMVMNAGNAIFLRLFNTVYGSHLKDPFTMYKVFRRDALDGIRLECNRFDFDWELTGKLVRLGHKAVEVPVFYQSRSFSEGKKIDVVRDPITWLVACFKYRFADLEERDPAPARPREDDTLDDDGTVVLLSGGAEFVERVPGSPSA